MFGNDSKPSRIYSYKARAPVDGVELADDQMSLGHRYKNTLVELERDRRARVDEAVRVHSPEVPVMEERVRAAEAAVLEAEQVIKDRSKGDRKRSPATAAEKAALAALRAERREARAALKALRAEAFAGNGPQRAALAEVDAGHLAAQKAARAASGLYWGNYLLVEQSMMGVRKGPPPRFRRWDGSGAVAVQLQGGLSWADALAGADSRLRVEVLPPSPAADPASRRSLTKAGAVVWFRAGSDGRNPKWVRVPVRLHRQPPPDSRVKWAYLHRVPVGGGVRWDAQFVLERESWDRDGGPAGGEVGLDVNWRSTPDGLRVAYAVGDDGAESTLFLPRDWLDGWSKVESLQAIRDRNFNEARAGLVAWLAANVAPEAFRERAAHLPLWKDAGRLAALVWNWRVRRFDGDAGVYTEMEAWRKQDRHLHDWQDSQHKKVVRRRDDLYRKFASALAARYRTVVMEDTNWRELKAVPGPDEESGAAARVYARVGAVGRLCRFVREAARETVKAPAAYTTRRCHACGSVEDFDAAKELAHACSGCGSVWDQDRNAALNLLAFAAEAPAV